MKNNFSYYLNLHKTFLEGYSLAYGRPYISCCDYTEDFYEAYKKFNQAIDEGDMLGYYGLALVSDFAKNKQFKYSYKRAIKKLNKMDKEDPIVLFIFAMCHMFGDGLEKDIKQTLKYFDLSQKKGCYFVYPELTELYLEGKEVPRNLKLFENYLKLSENFKCYYIYNTVAYIFFENIKDYNKSKEYAIKSINNGNLYSAITLTNVLYSPLTSFKATSKEIKLLDKTFKECIKLHPDDLYIQYVYAVFLSKQKNLDMRMKSGFLLKSLAEKGEKNSIPLYEEIKDDLGEVIQAFGKVKDIYTVLNIDVPENSIFETKSLTRIEKEFFKSTEINENNFVDICTKIFTNMGYEVKETKLNSNFDLFLFKKDDLFNQKIIVKCTHSDEFSIDEEDVYNLYRNLLIEKADKAIYITDFVFSNDALKFSLGKPIQLIEHDKYFELYKKYYFKNFK